MKATATILWAVPAAILAYLPVGSADAAALTIVPVMASFDNQPGALLPALSDADVPPATDYQAVLESLFADAPYLDEDPEYFGTDEND